MASAALARDKTLAELAQRFEVPPQPDSATHMLSRAVEEFHTYIANNEAFIPNYGERYRQEERISTGFVESAVNYVVSKRFTKRQQMEWRLAFLRTRL